MNDRDLLLLAIEKAKESVRLGGFPAGAVVARGGLVLGEGVSIGNVLHDPTSHGEMAAIRAACTNATATDLSQCVLYASMQPCLMCFGASVWSSISRIVFACSQERVSPDYYGGSYSLQILSHGLNRPIELIHLVELEETSLSVVREWEMSL